MKVLHLIDTFWLGGAQKLLKDFFESEPGNANIFVYSLRKRDVNISIIHPNVFCDPSPMRFSAGRIPRLVRFVRKYKIDILHCHLPHSQFTGYILKRFYFKNIRLIFHDHSDIMEPAWHVKTALRLTHGRADRIVTCAQHLVKHLMEKAGVPENKITVIPNFILPEIFSSISNDEAIKFRSRFGVPSDAPLAGFAGRFVTRKGWKDFIDAAAIVAKEVPEVYFIMAGTGPDLEKAKKYASEKMMGSKIIFPGYVENMPVFYKALNVYIVPSHWEGMPLAPAESLAAGTPVVAFDAPGLRYYHPIDESILYAKLHNVEQLSLFTKSFLTHERVMPAIADLSYLSLGRFREDVEKLYATL